MRVTAPVLTLALLCLIACDSSTKKKSKDKAPSDAKAECRKEQTEMLSKCTPVCNADPNLTGEKYDACLQDCAMEKFGKEIRMCSEL